MARARKMATAKDADGNVVMELIVPAAENDALSVAMRVLTHQLGEKNPELRGGGGMGGEFGYGVNFENETFLMHPFCWCESDDCPWCAGCECPPSAFHHFVDGREVTYEEWDRFYCDHVYGEGKTFKDWLDSGDRSPANEALSTAINARRSTSCDAVCDYHRGTGIFERFGGPAPNFWHKPSGLKVRWYKYIGRDMDGEEGTATSVHDVLADCLRSINAPNVEYALKAYEQAENASQERFAAAMNAMFRAVSETRG